MTSSITFIPGRTTGSRNVIHDGYRYCLDKKRDEKTYWRCTDKTCSGRLNLVNEPRLLDHSPSKPCPNSTVNRPPWLRWHELLGRKLTDIQSPPAPLKTFS